MKLTLIYKLRKIMKKIIATFCTLFLFTTISAKAEIGFGITGAVHMIDGKGTEITRESGERNKGSHDETAVIPELFIEAISETGFTMGISYVPTRELGSKSRSDTNSDGDTGTYTAKAELDDVVQFYADIPAAEIYGFQTHVKLGIQHVELTSLESLNSGSAYPSKDILGYTIGYGIKGDLAYGEGLYYKGELTYTNFEDITLDSTAGNKVEAELEDYAAKISIGYKF
jgi:hypothetical protein